MNTECIGGSNFKDTRIPQLPNFNIDKQIQKKSFGSSLKDKIKNLAIDGMSIKEVLLQRKLNKLKAQREQ